MQRIPINFTNSQYTTPIITLPSCSDKYEEKRAFRRNKSGDITRTFTYQKNDVEEGAKQPPAIIAAFVKRSGVEEETVI